MPLSSAPLHALLQHLGSLIAKFAYRKCCEFIHSSEMRRVLRNIWSKVRLTLPNFRIRASLDVHITSPGACAPEEGIKTELPETSLTEVPPKSKLKKPPPRQATAKKQSVSNKVGATRNPPSPRRIRYKKASSATENSNPSKCSS